MNTTWMDEQFMLSFYQTCLTLLVWLLATFTFLTVMAALVMLYHECRFCSGPDMQGSKSHSDIGIHEGKLNHVRFLSSLEARQDEMNKT